MFYSGRVCVSWGLGEKGEGGLGGAYNLLPAWPAALEKGLFDLGLGWVFGPGGELFEVGGGRGCEAASRLQLQLRAQDWEAMVAFGDACAAEERAQAGKGPEHGGCCPSQVMSSTVSSGGGGVAGWVLAPDVAAATACTVQSGLHERWWG